MRRYCWSDNAMQCQALPELQVWFRGPSVGTVSGSISCLSVCFGHLKPFIAAYVNSDEKLTVYKIVHHDSGQELWHTLSNGMWSDEWYAGFIEAYSGLRREAVT